jgi:hypothetical protein
MSISLKQRLKMRKRIEAMIRALGSNPHVRVSKSVVKPAATTAELAQARRMAGGRLPSGAEAFYKELNGLELAWKHTVKGIAKGDQSDGGYINLLPIQNVFVDWMGVTWFESVPDGERFRPVKPFDLFQPEACACFTQDAGAAVRDDVYLHYLGEGLTPALCTFPEYMERLLASRGRWYWLTTLSPDSSGSEETQAFFSDMPRIFPDFNPELFRPLR